MISEVPRLSQDFCGWARGKQHHFVSIISFLRGYGSSEIGARFRQKVGQEFEPKWGVIPTASGAGVRTEVGRGFDGKWGTFEVAVVTVPRLPRNGAPSNS